MQPDWSAYYRAVEGRPPRPTLLKALSLFSNEVSNEFSSEDPSNRYAIDLGCGDGRDTVELLQRGWRVLGIDAEAEAIDRLRQRSDVNIGQLTTQVTRFEFLTLPRSVDLINASFTLPFCPPARFSHLWSEIVASLRIGGRFCGQLFGERDSWATNPDMTHHSREQVEALLQPFVVEYFEEEEHPGITALGQEKHWHIFHIVARRC
jgi:tellurite methyltransferase